MAIGTAIALGSLAIGAASAGVQFIGQKRATKASERAEALRQQQANLDAIRARRERIREAMVARATSLTNLVSQGALGSSAQAGAEAQISGRLGQNLLGIRQNQQIGSGIFSANRAFASGQGLAAFGSGLQNFGSSILNISQSPFFSGGTSPAFSTVNDPTRIGTLV